MTQSIQAVRAGLFVVCKTLIFADETDGNNKPVHVSYGPPGTHQPHYIVGVAMEVRQPITTPTMSPRRSRERKAEIDSIISCYVPGTDKGQAQQAAADACDRLVGLFEDYFRTDPNQTLGGACRNSWVSHVDGPRLDLAVNPKSGAPTGRIAEATVTVTAEIRY